MHTTLTHSAVSSIATIEEHTIITRTLRPSAVVLDFGANVGQFSKTMVDRYGCMCHAVEPSPSMWPRIPKDPRIHLHQLAMSGAQGEATFHVSTDPLGSSLHTTDQLSYTEQITVLTQTLPGLLAELGLARADLAKFDIEGAEIDVFDACSDEDLNRVDQYSVEFHDFNGTTPVADVHRVLDRFRSLGYLVYRSSWVANFDVLIAHPERLGISKAEWLWIQSGRHYLTGVDRLTRKVVRRIRR